MTDERELADRWSTVRVAAARGALRSRASCRIRDAVGTIRVFPIDGLAEGSTPLRSPDARLVLTGSRAQTLGLAVPASGCVALPITEVTSAWAILSLARVDEDASGALGVGILVEHAREAERAGIELAKRAGLLPLLLSLTGCEDADADEPLLEAAEVFGESRREIRSLHPVVETRLPITATEHGRMVVFRGDGGGPEQVAILIGDPRAEVAPLCRLHSECMTGDLFGSMRCDCGEQLDGALNLMAEAGSGVLLYLRQEGRGIGLVNKIRAYRLQDQGFDTVDANTHLGFQPDERDFGIAARMLEELGLRRIRLLTNNPEKVAALRRNDIRVDERVPLTFAANRHNRAYLETKAKRSGHLLRIIPGGRGRRGLARTADEDPASEASGS
jgi:GTP cyclohydrolase II